MADTTLQQTCLLAVMLGSCLSLLMQACVLYVSQISCLMQVRDFRTFIRREIEHQSSLQHPFIISIEEVILLAPAAKLHIHQLHNAHVISRGSI